MYTLKIYNYTTGKSDPADEDTTKKMIAKFRPRGTLCVCPCMDARYIFTRTES